MDRKEIIELLKTPIDKDLLKTPLFQKANDMRREKVGDEVYLRGLIEFSNFCEKDCLYCGIRKSNKNCKRYRLSPEQIIFYANNAVGLGFKTIVLQSGEDSFYTKEIMSDLIKEIKKLNVAITLSVGEKTFDEYEAYKNAGADRFLMRIETTDKTLYKKMHPYALWQKRMQSLQELKNLGFELGSGSLIGLPGQTIESLADDILFFKDIGCDMIGIGPFLPNKNTPLKNMEKGSFELALKVMAIVRIILPYSNIPATTAMETIVNDGRQIALMCGANVVMPNVVDYEINKNYLLYENKFSNSQGIKQSLDKIIEKINSINRTVNFSIGESKSYSMKNKNNNC